jgi:hypothetical protein
VASHNHFTIHRRGGPLRCLGCKRRIVWGERCEDCKRLLRQRQRRKLR